MQDHTLFEEAQDILEITVEELCKITELINTKVNKLCAPNPDMTEAQKEAGLELIKIAGKCSELAAMLKPVDIKTENGISSVDVSAGQVMARCILITAVAILSSFFMTLRINKALELTALVMMLTSGSQLNHAGMYIVEIDKLVAPAEGETVH